MLRLLPLKMLSLFIALVLAYAVRSGGNASVVSLFVPIEVKNAPEDKAIVRPIKRGVQLTLKGPSFLISPLVSSPPPVRIKLPDTHGDRVSVSFSSADISLPSSIEVLNIEPPQMEFVFEALERQELRVEVPRVGQLPKHLVLEGIEITPKTVSVRGPKSEVRQLKLVEAEPINLSEIGSATELTLNLRALGGSVIPSTKTVVVKVYVGQQPTQKTFSDSPVELRVAGGIGGVMLTPERVTIRVAGAPDLLASLEQEKVIPYVRISGIVRAKSARHKVDVEVPAGVRVVSVEPSEIEVQQKEAAMQRGVVKKR